MWYTSARTCKLTAVTRYLAAAFAPYFRRLTAAPARRGNSRSRWITARIVRKRTRRSLFVFSLRPPRARIADYEGRGWRGLDEQRMSNCRRRHHVRVTVIRGPFSVALNSTSGGQTPRNCTLLRTSFNCRDAVSSATAYILKKKKIRFEISTTGMIETKPIRACSLGY